MIQGRLGEFHRVTIDPFQRQGFHIFGELVLLMLEAVIVFDLTHLLAHACAKQGLVISKGHANPIAPGLFLAPGDIAGVVRCFTQAWHVHVDCRAASPPSVTIACDACEADRVQLVARKRSLFAGGYLNRDIIWVR